YPIVSLRCDWLSTTSVASAAREEAASRGASGSVAGATAQAEAMHANANAGAGTRRTLERARTMRSSRMGRRGARLRRLLRQLTRARQCGAEENGPDDLVDRDHGQGHRLDLPAVLAECACRDSCEPECDTGLGHEPHPCVAFHLRLRSRPLCPDACSEPESARAQCDRAESDRPERCELAQVDRSACDAEEHHVCR